MEKLIDSSELFFIISPPPAIAEYVAFLKGHVRSVIGHGFEDEFSKAHISLFKYRDPHAEDLLYTIDSRVASFTPFHVHIKDLNYADPTSAIDYAKASSVKKATVGRHGTTRTIYLEIVHKNPICEIFANIAREDVSFTPRITIASNLDMNDFVKVWKSLKHLSYSDYFLCDHITVLKKAPRKWVHYIDLEFAA